MKKIGTLVALFATLLLTGLTLAGPAPASAETAVVEDNKTNDAPARFDIVRLNATNARHLIRAALHVRDLDDRGEFVLGVTWSDENIAYEFYVRVRKNDDGDLVTRFRRSKEGNDVDPKWKCGRNHADVEWNEDTDRIILTAPRKCLRKYDYYKVINNWNFYAYSAGFVHDERTVDVMPHTRRLKRG